MRVLLIYPDISRGVEEREVFLQSTFPSLGVNYLATTLSKSGHQVFVYDIFFNYLSNCYQPDSTFIRLVERTIKQIKPKVVGISFLTPSRRESLQVARLMKKIDPKTLVVAGGAHATIMYEQLLSNYLEIDVVVIGEGEITFPELIEAFETKTDLYEVKGIAFRKEETSEIIVTLPRPLIQDLDSIPMPNYDQYLQFIPKGKLLTASIITGRGCTYGKCQFCASRSLWPNCRVRTAKNVVDEIEILTKEYSVENIRIHDDTFTSFPERAVQIFGEIVNRKLKITIDFKTIFNKITPHLLYWFKKAGGRSIFYGLESASERLRNLMRKPKISNEDIKLIVNINKKYGIKVGLFVMFGYPGETIEDIRETYDLLEKLNPDRVRCTITKVYPGTQLYQYATKRKIICDKYWLNEDPDHRYFTFLNKEEIAELKRYDLLFSGRFNGSELWAEYDEQDISYYIDHGDSYLLEEIDKQKLFNKMARQTASILTDLNNKIVKEHNEGNCQAIQ